MFSRFSVAPRGFSLGVFRFSPVLRKPIPGGCVRVFHDTNKSLSIYFIISAFSSHCKILGQVTPRCHD